MKLAEFLMLFQPFVDHVAAWGAVYFLLIPTLGAFVVPAVWIAWDTFRDLDRWLSK